MKKILLSLTLLLMSAAFLFAQNSCEEALPLAEGTYTVDTIDGTPIVSPCFMEDPQTATEWYYYENTSSEEYAVVNITTDLPQNAGGDTRFSVLSGSCDALECVAGADDVGTGNYLSEVTFTVPPLTTYIVVFDNRWSSAGFDFDVSVSLEAPDCSTNLPFTEDFESAPDFSVCYTIEDVDANTFSWISQQDLDLDGDGTPETFATNAGGTTEENDYLISPAFQLNADVEYILTAHFNGYNQENPSNQYLTAVLLDAPNSSANVVATIFDAVNVTNGEFATLETNAIEQTEIFMPDADGEYYIAFIATTQGDHANGFTLLFDYTVVRIVSVADEVVENASVVYPNPVKDIVNIRLSNDYDVAKTIITLTNVSGKQVARFSNVNEINVANLSSGVYVMTITDGNKIETKKLVKK